MFAEYNLNGSALPHKTLCLTFDDGPGEIYGNGPGPKTIRLAEYLVAEGIHATFFMTGKHLAQYPHLAQQVLAMGHTIGNHTYYHPNFLKPETFNPGETALTEIERTEALISASNPSKNIFFRAPYGDWSKNVATILNTSLKSDINYTGPIGWDINENDWQFWLNADTPENCAEAYLQGIQQVGRGIVVMHDSTTDHDVIKANNRTFEMVKILIPQLKSLGYSFVRLEDVPLLVQHP